MQRSAFHNNITFRILWPLLYGSLLYLLILLLNNNLDTLGVSFFSQELLFTIGLTAIVFESSRATILVLEKRTYASAAFRIIIKVLGTFIVTLVMVGAMVSLYFKLYLGYSSYGSFAQELHMFLFIFTPSSIVYAVLIVGNQYLFEENKELVEQEKLLAENLELELINYQNDVNPDLFYDSLESVISLLHKDPFEAEDYIDRLAMVYRHILSNKHAELTAFESEYKTAENVVALFGVKYPNQISIQNTLEAKNILVIPGALSSLVEFIIRNSIITPTLPLRITIEMESRAYFVVRYTLNERLQHKLSFKEIQKAYAIFEQPVVTVKAYGEHFIKIPILEMEESPDKKAV